MGFYREAILPWIMDAAGDARVLRRIRAEVLRDVRGRVLEIGFGTGLNLPFYPPEVREITAVEPSPGMTRRAGKHLRRWGGSVRLRLVAAEALPFDDRSFDAVVVTFTLCTVKDPARALAEARRVLVPGGALHFLEHVASHDPAWRRRQERMNGFQKLVAGGCHLTRDTEAAIVAAGFRIERIEREVPGGVPAWMANFFPVVWGCAVAP